MKQDCGKLLRLMRSSYPAFNRYLFPLWEPVGLVAYDLGLLSPATASHATYSTTGITYGKPTIYPQIPLMAGFDGVDGKIIINVATCLTYSVKNFGMNAFVAVLNVVESAHDQQIIYESVAGDANVPRYSLVLKSNRKLELKLNVGTAVGTEVTFTTDNPLPLGINMIVINSCTYPVANKTVVFYNNGELITHTGGTVPNIPFANTDPASGVILGNNNAGTAPFAGDMGMVARYRTFIPAMFIKKMAQIGGIYDE